ncbi:MAG: sigma 54-interacting transcriptional regulator [Bryobacterales bacterium]|nr:sigma 54-interacting transcriptional regulator [Bryobacterales bacterium]
MPARLLAISGPFQGATYELSGAETVIGRLGECQVSLPDAEISKRHCSVTQVDGKYEMRDLGSLNGVYVNGILAKHHVLKAGDLIRLGRSVFSFDLGSLTQTAERVRFDDTVMMSGTVELSSSDIPDRDLRLLLDVSAVLKEMRALTSAANASQAVAARILEVVLRAIPADYGAVLIDPEGPNETITQIQGSSRGSSMSGVPLSRSIVRKVIAEKVAVLLTDSGELTSESIVGLQLRNILAAPLHVRDPFQTAPQAPITGLIYLALTGGAARYNRRHLELLASIAEIASTALENLGYVEWLHAENRRLAEENQLQHDMVGRSPAMQTLYNQISRVAATNSTVLLQGESGTGKELVARAIHRNSPRANGPFVAVNCAAIQETLLESELFGHEKGAFTDAKVQKRGKLEVAEGGTVFLDEIGEMPLSIQAKLLRVLQQREFERVGGTKTLKLDIRVIAATNRNLDQEVKSGRFREDLYFRLNVISLRTPPLRDRREDILALSQHFAAKYGESCNRAITAIAPKAQRLLLHYSWPGNVRELENAIERAVVMGSGDIILPEDLPEALFETSTETETPDKGLHTAVQDAKRRIVSEALAQTGGNFVKAAQILDVHPNYLHRLVNNLGLRES